MAHVPAHSRRFVCALGAGVATHGARALATCALVTCTLVAPALTATPTDDAAANDAFLRNAVRAAPRGSYPRGVAGEPMSWTVVGSLEGDTQRVLMSEDGAIETGRARFSIEPFLFANGKLITWSDARVVQGLRDGQLPPRVVWEAADAGLQLTVVPMSLPAAHELEEEAKEEGEENPALAIAGDADRILMRYYVRNRLARPVSARLYLAVRPFQVYQPDRRIGAPIELAPIHDIAGDGRIVRVDDSLGVVSLAEPVGFGAVAFERGDIVRFLRSGRLPREDRVHDDRGLASAAFEYRLELLPTGDAEVNLVIPLHERPSPLAPSDLVEAVAETMTEVLKEAHEMRRDVDIPPLPVLPSGRDPFDSLNPQLAALLIGRDRGALQSGSRADRRTRMRDAALECSALLRLGHEATVREFLEWFARFQLADGRVPCCIEEGRADRTPEHDSEGAFIFCLAEYYRYTGDRVRVHRWWPKALAAANAIDALRRTQRTVRWSTPDRKPLFGVMPPSSRGDAAGDPAYTYRDDLFALRGLKDAVYLAGALGRTTERTRLVRIRDEFKRDLGTSIVAAMAARAVDYLPGSPDAADPDPVNAALALDPVQAEGVVPRAVLERTFERYWESFRARRDGQGGKDTLALRELRIVGAFVRLGWRDRAQELLEFFLERQRPEAWRQWPEAVWSDRHTPRFSGDLPNTSVGSDYIRSALDMLVYPRERDAALVVGAGVTHSWLAGSGVTARGLPTPYGRLGLTMSAGGDTVEVNLEGRLRIPRGGIAVSPPAPRPFRSATIGVVKAPISPAGEVIVRSLPARIRFVP